MYQFVFSTDISHDFFLQKLDPGWLQEFRRMLIHLLKKMRYVPDPEILIRQSSVSFGLCFKKNNIIHFDFYPQQATSSRPFANRTPCSWRKRRPSGKMEIRVIGAGPLLRLSIGRYVNGVGWGDVVWRGMVFGVVKREASGSWRKRRLVSPFNAFFIRKVYIYCQGVGEGQ